MKHYYSNKKGTSIVEALVYIAILVMLFAGIVRGVFMLTTSYRNVKVYRSIEVTAVNVMERMIREIRNATSVNTAQTSYTVSPGSLSLNTTNASGTAMTVRFYVATSTSRMYMEENGVNLGPLTPSDISVSSLVFKSFSTSTSAAVKIEMTLSSASSAVSFSKNFYSTAVIRGSY
jgi:Tfp pilus assembly protein PilW